jgi:penicillin-binding protein 1A
VFLRPLRLLAGLTFTLCLISVAIGGWVLRRQLPPIFSLADYEPIQASEVFSDDGQRIGLFALERRTAVPFESLPQNVVYAFLAAEDAGFYAHEGIDWFGVGRALIKNMRPGAHLQGASTITQQTVKTLIVGPERSLWRKAREAVLARRLEQMLPKDAILTLYLNQIYFGNGAWGVEQAAQTYFAKHVRDVDLFEAALLAAIPKNPSRYTLKGDLVATKARQRYVLEQMGSHGWASPGAIAQAMARPLPPMPEPPAHKTASIAYVEHVRRELGAVYGDELLNTGGLRIYTHLNVAEQLAASQAIAQTSDEVARRHGYTGPPGRIEADAFTEVYTALQAAFAQKQAVSQSHHIDGTPYAWDLADIGPSPRRANAQLAKEVQRVPRLAYQRLRGLVVQVPHDGGPALVDLGSTLAQLPVRGLAWARPYNPVAQTPMPKRPSDVVRVGDLITVEILPDRLVAQGGAHAPKTVEVALVPEPQVQGALVSMMPPYGVVRAMVGSRDPSAGGGFNRATQARRQPGSAFKPILYAAGLADGIITPASVCSDSPVVITDPMTGQLWKPENYEDGRYDGNILYRTALARSKNTCSVRLLQKVGVPALCAMAQSLGVEESLPHNLTLALGTGEVTPLHMATVMHTLANAGTWHAPQFIQRVHDRHGVALDLPPSPTPHQALTPEATFVLTSMLRSVVESGTAKRAKVLGRPLAAKTGTSQLGRDAWLVGYAPTRAAAVWFGLDNDTPMGRETGGSAALPAWVRFMGTALAHEPVTDFSMPPGVELHRIDPMSGGASDTAGSVVEVFVPGTAPQAGTDALPSIYLEDEDAP